MPRQYGRKKTHSILVPANEQFTISTSKHSSELSSSEEIQHHHPDENEYTFEFKDSLATENQFDPLQINLNNIKHEDSVNDNIVMPLPECTNSKRRNVRKMYTRRWTKYQFLYKFKKRQAVRLNKKLDRLRFELKTVYRKYNNELKKKSVAKNHRHSAKLL